MSGTALVGGAPPVLECLPERYDLGSAVWEASLKPPFKPFKQDPLKGLTLQAPFNEGRSSLQTPDRGVQEKPRLTKACSATAKAKAKATSRKASTTSSREVARKATTAFFFVSRNTSAAGKSTPSRKWSAQKKSQNSNPGLLWNSGKWRAAAPLPTPPPFQTANSFPAMQLLPYFLSFSR